MSRPAVLAPQAKRELRHALRDIGRDNTAAAHGLNDAVQLAARRLGANPALGSLRPYVPARLRAWPLTRYGYLLVYDGSTDPVQILRVVHMARDLPRVLADLPGLSSEPEPPA